MTRMYVATPAGLAVLQRRNDRWSADIKLEGLPAQCVAVNPTNARQVFCGTFGRGLWQSADAGENWEPVAEGAMHSEVTAVAQAVDGVVWAGTEPSAVFRSQDGGRTWTEMKSLQELPSKPTWSFPPRPWTSHVRWIQPDLNKAGRIFVGIELGGVMRSEDTGETWEDRKPGSQFDAHTLRAHPLAPDRVYEAAGGGYAETDDGGETWHGHDEGLTRRYVWGLAIDPADPDVMIVSAAPGPREAHGDPGESAIYRRVGNSPWKEISDGLPAPAGTRAYVLASTPSEPHVFYAVTRNGDIYRSADTGLAWRQEPVTWRDGYRVDDVRAVEVIGED